MSEKKWFLMLFSSIGLIAILIAAFNFVVDPFGVWGDRFMQKPSFNMTNNPKTAKLKYIDENHDKYNAYVIGASGSSSLSVEKLNEYTGLSWYNMFNYGADMAYTQKLARYLIENYEVKHIILNLTLTNAQQYNIEAAKITDRIPPQVSGWFNYIRFLYANPRYGYEKIKNSMADTYLPQKFDVFVYDSGVYDKSVRDIEPIGSLDEYLTLYPEYTVGNEHTQSLPNIDKCVKAVAEIKELCDLYNIDMTVIIPPLLEAEISSYNKNEVAELFRKLAYVTEFLDFTASAVSLDSRYFYDTTHFRNAVGDMILAKIYGDESIFVPSDLGVTVNKSNVDGIVSDLWNIDVEKRVSNTYNIPVLMYHHFADTGDKGTTISPALFEEHIKALKNSGYSSASLEDLINYVYKGVDLPPKAIAITIDDGYSSNYEYAYPILKKHGFNATIFVIGVSTGKDQYKDTGEPIIPHFGDYEMCLMSDSGVISIQSHTYDMHNSEKFDSPFRKGILKMDNEDDETYIEALREDFSMSKSLLENATGKTIYALSYPFGLYDKLPAALLHEMGVKATFTSDAGNNVIIKGLPQSLFGLKRYNIEGNISPEELIKIVDVDNNSNVEK